MKILISLVLISIIIFSCKNVTGEQQDKLLTDVFNLHDELMKSYVPLNSMHSQLKTLLTKSDSIPNGFTKEDVIEAANHTEKAYNDMGDWMKDFKVPENLNKADKVKYLTDQKTKLEKLKEDTQRAISEANAIIHIKK
ncbi:MAG TPA: hypothetical protein VK590_11280 [Saprospiraceae bacterium]|nr:hypothetical protein [Saprospiraceae bacterium]